jgi:hypothetical protein
MLNGILILFYSRSIKIRFSFVYSIVIDELHFLFRSSTTPTPWSLIPIKTPIIYKQKDLMLIQDYKSFSHLKTCCLQKVNFRIQNTQSAFLFEEASLSEIRYSRKWKLITPRKPDVSHIKGPIVYYVVGGGGGFLGKKRSKICTPLLYPSIQNVPPPFIII